MSKHRKPHTTRRQMPAKLATLPPSVRSRVFEAIHDAGHLLVGHLLAVAVHIIIAASRPSIGPHRRARPDGRAPAPADSAPEQPARIEETRGELRPQARASWRVRAMVSLGGMVAEGLLLDSPFLQPTPARLATDLADAEGAILEGVTSDDLPRQKMLVSDAVYDLLVAHIPELNALTRVLFVRRTLEPGGVKELLAPFAAATDPAGKATALGRVKCPPTLKLVTGDGVFRTHASIRNTGPIAEDRRGDDHEHRRLWN